MRKELEEECVICQNTCPFNEDFLKNYNEESKEGYSLEVDVQYPEKLHQLHHDLPFLLERMKLEKFEKPVINLHDKTEYAINIRNLKQALNHGLISKVITFNQKAYRKRYVYMNTNLRPKVRTSFEKGFFKSINNAVFGKTMENVRNHRNIKLLKTEKRRNYLVSEPNYHTRKFFTENWLAIEMRKTQILMNKPLYLGLSILYLNQTVMSKFWYDYVNPKHGGNAKRCYMDTESFIFHVNTIYLQRYCRNKMLK